VVSRLFGATNGLLYVPGTRGLDSIFVGYYKGTGLSFKPSVQSAPIRQELAFHQKVSKVSPILRRKEPAPSLLHHERYCSGVDQAARGSCYR
jgi:hypothetical protein